MPIYEYKAVNTNPENSCDYCRGVFEKIKKAGQPLLKTCPKCGNPVKKIISRVGVTYGLDFKAKGTGLHKLVRKDKGIYEKKY